MANRGGEKTALKLAFEPDDYLCTWHVPVGDGGFTDIQGLLTVQPSRPPTGQIYGELPINWTVDSRGQKSAGFPQYLEIDVLSGRLSTGANVMLIDAQITYWFHNRGHISGAAAVVTLDEVARDAAPRFFRVELQVDALDAVAGVAPLKRMSWPNREDARHLEGPWSAEGNPGSSQEWSDDDAVIRLEYDATVRAFDPYSYRMGFSPVVRMESSEPLTVREWVDQWVEPVRRIVSIATAGTRALTYLATRRPASERSTVRGQVFGTGITQEPYESLRTRVQDMRPALMLKVDDISLLALVRKWQRLDAEHHPLIETYGSMLTSRDQHPRSRFLLLVQAIEGLHGHEEAANYEERRKRHEEQREKLIQTVAEHLDPESVRFLKRNLRKDPPTSLQDALRAVISGSPIDLMPKLDRTGLVGAVKVDHPNPETTVSALRVVRNNLAHGLRGYEPHLLHDVVNIFERVVRAQALRLLGCPEEVQERALQAAR